AGLRGAHGQVRALAAAAQRRRPPRQQRSASGRPPAPPRAGPLQEPERPGHRVNLIACYQHLDKPADFTQRFVNQLKSVAPNHPYVQSLATVEGAFERVAANYSL
ncbi:unnamed protein product, partial [Heterosigma akashiwo]